MPASTNERQFDGLAYFRGQLWAKCKARKSGVCHVGGNQYHPGDDIYRPIGNAKNRGLRILVKNLKPTSTLSDTVMAEAIDSTFGDRK
jgi:hypothetical protein